MIDTRTFEQKRKLEKQLRVRFGMLEIYERHLAILCHNKYVSEKLQRGLNEKA